MTDHILKADPIFGFTDRLTVKLDLDEMAFKVVLYWAMFALEKFDLGGFIILKSSKNSYHVVFDRYAESFEENICVVAWVARLSNSLPALKYLAMQCIKRSSTLRILEKDGKPAPRIVYRFGSQNQAIKDFLEYRAMIKKIVKEVKESDV